MRQFVEARLANEAADAGDARIVLRHDLCRSRIGHLMIHRAKLEHVDALVVESEPLLLEQYRALAVELDGERHQRHHWRQTHEGDGADDAVEQPFHHQIPVGDRGLEHVERRHVADEGVGAGAKPQFVGMRRQPDIDRQHP